MLRTSSSNTAELVAMFDVEYTAVVNESTGASAELMQEQANDLQTGIKDELEVFMEEIVQDWHYKT